MIFFAARFSDHLACCMVREMLNICGCKAAMARMRGSYWNGRIRKVHVSVLLVMRRMRYWGDGEWENLDERSGS